jgi:hypothetical protein
VYKNNGDGTFNATSIDVGGSNNGLGYGSAAWGDYDNDGDLDILVSGLDASNNKQLRVYKNNGDGTFSPTPMNVAGLNNGLYNSSVAWGDYDNDGGLDILVSGLDASNNKQLRVYHSFQPLGTANVTPSAPSNITASWTYNISRSTLTFKWNAGSYDTGFSSNSVNYNLWVATNTLASAPPSGFEREFIAPRQGSPFLGNYLKPAIKTWPSDGAAKFGVYVATRPNISSNALTTDTTYYFRVQTIDSSLAGSAWSSQQTERTDVAPSAVTNLAGAASISATSAIDLTWTSSGDDQTTGALSPGTFRIFYSTASGDMTGLIATTSTTTTLSKIDISTTGVNPGTTRYATATGLIGLQTYYIRIFTADEVPNWSTLSNGATVAASAGIPGIVSASSGNWFTPATWSGGVVPVSGSTVTISSPHVVTATATVTISSISVASGGTLRLDGTNQSVTFTIQNGGKLCNYGTVQVLNSANNVTLQGASGGSMTFEGTDIDYNANKIYLGRLSYRPAMSLASGETVELSGDMTLGNTLTTAAGSSFVMGANSILTLTGNTTLASGTFTRGTGTARVKLNGTIALDSRNQNLGDVSTGP